MSNTSKSNAEGRSGKKLKILKYSNIEYFKDSNSRKPKHLNTREGNRKKSQTSAGFTIWEKRVNNVQKIYTPNNKEFDANKINEFVDDEIDLSYQDINESPSHNCKGSPAKALVKTNKNTSNKEVESIVPPLALKNIGGNRTTQNGTTGKLTRTTMQSTHIRDKIGFKQTQSNNANTAQSNQRSIGDSRRFVFIV